MREIAVRELKATLSETLRAVGRGERVRVTVRGRPVAEIVPISTEPDAYQRLIDEGRITPATRPGRRTRRAWSRSRLSLGVGHRRTGRRALRLYLDASALVKRFIAEADSDVVERAVRDAESLHMCRVGYVETVRAVGLYGGAVAVRDVEEAWGSIDVVEADQPLVEEAGRLAVAHRLRSIDAIHLAAALLLPFDDVVMASWDRRLHAAARDAELDVLPRSLD